MQKVFLAFFLQSLAVAAGAQNVGIGTATPQARLQVESGSVAFTAAGNIPASIGDIPVTGPGRRLLWYADKASLRAGYVNGNAWDKDQVGRYSAAMGFNTLASGDAATAAGAETKAAGTYATALGWRSDANGYASTALGANTLASGLASSAIGSNTTASGELSTAMGFSSSASGRSSLATGENTMASGWGATALGLYTTARSYASLAIGQYNDSIISSSQTDWQLTDPLLTIGNGTSAANRRNAMTVYKNGNTDLNGFTRLGSLADNAPRIKVKKLTTTLNASANGSVAHGLTESKILDLQVKVTNQFNSLVFDGNNIANNSFNAYISGGNVVINGVSGSVGDIINRPATILITYEE